VVAGDAAFAALDAAGAARVGATAETRPIADDAVDGALFCVALFFLVSHRAQNAAIKGVGGNRTGTSPLAGAATGSAIAPSYPIAPNAVLRAVCIVAGLGFVEEWADVAVVLIYGSDVTGTGLEARVASLAAIAPANPIADFAVNRARAIVATLSLCGLLVVVAQRTAVTGRSGDGTGSSL